MAAAVVVDQSNHTVVDNPHMAGKLDHTGIVAGRLDHTDTDDVANPSGHTYDVEDTSDNTDISVAYTSDQTDIVATEPTSPTSALPVTTCIPPPTVTPTTPPDVSSTTCGLTTTLNEDPVMTTTTTATTSRAEEGAALCPDDPVMTITTTTATNIHTVEKGAAALGLEDPVLTITTTTATPTPTRAEKVAALGPEDPVLTIKTTTATITPRAEEGAALGLARTGPSGDPVVPVPCASPDTTLANGDMNMIFVVETIKDRRMRKVCVFTVSFLNVYCISNLKVRTTNSDGDKSLTVQTVWHW